MYLRRLLFALLAGTSLTPLHAQDIGPIAEPEIGEAAPAAADEARPPAEAEQGHDDEFDDEEEGEEIVVTGQAPRGSVIGDIPPEVQLNRREIRAYGAGNLSELLDALAPQTRSGRGRGEGGGPVVLLNGRRISGFREIRDIPPEAIERVDILPEEVALRYGYRADQRVVNFVLRRRFRAVTTEVQGGLPTAGGRTSYGADANLLRIDQGGRWSLDLEFDHAGPLLESERDLIQANPDIARFRTLLPETDRLELGGTLNRFIFGDISATVNGSLDMSESKSRLGLPEDELGALVGTTPLIRETDTRTGHLGLALNGDIAPWRWSFTGNYDNNRTDTRTDTGVDTEDGARSTSRSADAQAVFNGPVVRLPAGQLAASLRAGVDTRNLESRAVRSGAVLSRDLGRDRAAAQASLDIPVASRRTGFLSEIGNLSLNLNGEVEQLSDFGTLTTWGYGARWAPIPQLDFALSVTDEDGAPTMQQLGDPTLPTPNVRVFDFTRGETVDITRLEGGNPDLVADNRHVFNLRLTARPLDDTDLSFVANYTRTRIRNPIASFPTATPEIEAAFPERFVRDATGRLIQIDARPINFARAEREELRWGVNFSQPIGPQGPPPGARAEWRERMRQRGTVGAEGAPAGAPGQAGESPPASGGEAGERRRGGRGEGGWRGGGGGGRGFGGGGRGFGGRGGGRLQLSLYHSWRFTDEILIRPGVPELDLLNGSAAGNRGGRPRHEIEAEAGLYRNGFGARLSANWQSGTNVRGRADGAGGSTGDLSFSDFATLNLRLFADLNQQRSLVRRYPFLRGTRISLSVDNLLDSRLGVRDETGATPLGYQGAYLDPLGRSVRISIRKLFF